MEQNEKTQNLSKNKKITHKNSKLLKNSASKQKYFDYYDDVKDGTHKVVDW